MRRLVSVAVTAALIGTASTASAAPSVSDEGSSSRAASAWRKTLSVGLRGETGFTGLAEGSKTSAWAIATRVGNDRSALLAYHWNGRSWKPVKVPGGLSASYEREAGSSQTPLSASSEKNAWLLAPGEFADRPNRHSCEAEAPLRITRPSRLARWNGGRFVAAGVFKDVVVTSVIATGRGKAWAFGSTTAGPVTLRYDGRKWIRSESTLSVTRATRVNGTIWAYGETPSGAPAVARFVGTRWKTVPTGDRLTAPFPTKTTAGRIVELTSIAPVPGGQVMIGGASLDVGTCDGAGSDTWRSFVYRWTGGSWVREKPKPLKNWTLTDQVPDGRGGTYALATRLWPASDSHPDVKDLFHRTTEGRWTRLPLPSGLSGVKTIAFLNARLLAAGHAETRYATTAAIWTRR